MKNILKHFLLAFGVMLVLQSCEKTVIDTVQFSDLEKGSYLKLAAKVNDIMDATLATSAVSIKVTEYGEPVDKIKIYVNPGSKSSNKANWKFIKEVPYSGETTLSVTNAEIAKAVGKALDPGVTYWLYNEVITKSGKTYSLVNTNSEIEANANYNMALTWKAVAVCPFIPADAVGTYEIVNDGWDGSVGSEATVTADATSVTVNLLFPAAAPPGVAPVKVTIDPKTGSATVAKQVYGSYGAGYENFAGSGTGFVFSCTGTIDLNIKHELGSSNYGTYRIVLKKKK